MAPVADVAPDADVTPVDDAAVAADVVASVFDASVEAEEAEEAEEAAVGFGATTRLGIPVAVATIAPALVCSTVRAFEYKEG